MEKVCKNGVEVVGDHIHIEAIKINDPLVNVFVIWALAGVFEEELDKAFYQPHDLVSERVFSCNSIFVDDAMLSVVVPHKIAKLSG